MGRQHLSELLELKNLLNKPDSTWILAFLIVIITSLAFYLYKKRFVQKRTDLLLTGFSDSGKTLLFTQLLYEKCSETFTSIKENIGEYNLKNGAIRIVDIPGHESLNEKYFHKYKTSAKGIIFLIDSSSIVKTACDVADYLYNVLFDEYTQNIPIIIACNKQDDVLAKSTDVIKELLEHELNCVSKIRSSALKAVGNNNSSKEKHVKIKKEFSFGQVAQRVHFVECSAFNNDLNQLQEKIERVIK